jgi:hypothetical protein
MKIHRIDIESKLNSYVYRIFPMERFIDVLTENMLTFSRPKLWRDPMETILFEANLYGKIKYPKDRFYGQCWTLNYESEALWNIYAPYKNGVRVKTKLNTLINDIQDINPELKNDWCVCGRVDYKPFSVIKTWFRDNSTYHDFLESYEKPFREVISLLIKSMKVK